MFLSWLHKIWKFLLTSIVILLITITVTGVLLFGALQLPVSQSYVSGQLTALFNNQFEGEIRIGDLDGLLPFRADIHKVEIYPFKNADEPVITIDKVSVNIGLWDLIRRNISIHSFKLESPVFYLTGNEIDKLTIVKAFKNRTARNQELQSLTTFNRFQVFAPSITIDDGHLVAVNINGDTSGSTTFPANFTFRNIEADFYLELSSLQRFLDIEYITAVSSDNAFGFEEFSFRGQVFSDDQYLEFNGFQFRADDSQVEFSSVSSPVNIFQPNLADQLLNANFSLDLQNSWLQGHHIASFLPEYPFPDHYLDLELILEGTLESMYIDRLIGRVGDNAVQMTGQLNNLNSQDFTYSASLTNVVLQPDILGLISDNYPEIGENEIEYLAESRVHGQLDGSLNNVNGSFFVETLRGELSVDGSISFEDTLSYDTVIQLDSLDLSPVMPQLLQRNLLNGRITMNGSGMSPDHLTGTFSANFDSGYVNHIDFSEFNFTGNLDNNNFEHNFIIRNGNSDVRLSGLTRRAGDGWAVSLNGATRNIDLRHLLHREDLPNTSISLEFSSDLEWVGLDDLFGRVSFQVDESVIGLDTLQAHQFYADLDAPGQPGGERNLRLTSSFVDAEIRGDIYPRNLINLFQHWRGYIKNQIAEEIVMDSTVVELEEDYSLSDQISVANLDFNMEIKDIELFQRYFYETPVLESRSRINMNMNSDADRLLLTGSVNDTGFRYNNFSSGSFNANFTTSFRFGEKFREYGTLDFQATAENYRHNNIQFREGYLNASMRSDSIMIHHSSVGSEDDVELDLNLVSKLHPDFIDVKLNNFSLGSDQYVWTIEGNPTFVFHSDRSLTLENINFVNNDEKIEINGTYSDREEDSVEYSIHNLNLQRISDLIGGRVSFAGIADGDFYTKTLTQIPVFEGDLDVRRLMLNNRLVGDVSVNSNYSAADEQFNTRVSVLTDPDEYPTYYAENDSIGQNLILEGYFKAPDLDNPDEEFYSFEADLREIDMWIVTVIVPTIITEMEGRSSGHGYIRGSLSEYDFNAEFDIEDVTGVPVFTNTRYNIDGNLIFDRIDGLIFEQINLIDNQGGSGVLNGTVDLDDFSETTYLDLTLDLNNLLFMNNPYDPDVPFYATVRGTGQARITGSNFSPFLRTTQPIVISPASRISVPILDDTELQQNYSFIQFVDSFDWSLVQEQDQNNNDNGNGFTFQFDQEALTFVERFTLDLQFTAQDPVNFRLIFDRVTNEILSASGTGQIRLSLQDENFSIFGRMKISGGDYQFVAGDIISRRFQLLEGGSIIWEGDPANARLNVNASYRARPDLSALVISGTRERQGGQRFPIDLVLNIGGTLSELENDFYFQIPSSIEGTLDPTLLNQVNALNRNEEEKIIQATSILLSGNFIPLSTASTEGGTGMALRETLTGGAVVVNPLITSQVINPLLSDQINSLLRSDMSLDIDFNLTTLNEIDLGVALRLYDDRLILRRDGVITGEYSDIGDLGATYRINRVFAVTAFHRQDPTLTNTSAAEVRQVQEMNGVGLEAQFQFNTWSELKQRITRAFNRLFGRKENDQQEETDDQGEPIASD